MTIGIIGLGLIGGSLAKDLRANGFADHILGCEYNPAHASLAASLGIADSLLTLEEICRQADLIILAVPVKAMRQLLPEIMNQIRPEAVVVDMGSTKKELCSHIATHPRRGRFVAAHPMAGTEHSGPAAAISNLFHGKAAIICEKEKSDPDALRIAERMFKSLFMRLLYMRPDDHDVHTAFVSHISHITSYVLALTVLEKEKSESNIFELASGGFASTVRLAKSSPRMWRDIYEQNADNILEVLDAYLEKMTQFRNLIANQQFDTTYQLMEEANQIRRILPT